MGSTSLSRSSIHLKGLGREVHYLLFELADRDLREFAEANGILDLALNLNIVHQVSLAMEQLHYNQIAHQDLKPSNVLLFPRSGAKVGDLGHARDRSVARPGKNRIIGGDPAHAALEQLYGYQAEEWIVRRLASDLYLLGSLIVFLFTGVSLTAQVAAELRPEHRWSNWRGRYSDVLPYVRDAWDAVIEESSSHIDVLIRDELISLIRYLTNPSPKLRGYPRNREGGAPDFGLRPFSSRFNVLAKKAEYKFPQRRSV